MLTSFECTCCGKTLKQPTFLNGKVYGADCKARITGQPKKKNKDYWIKAELVSIDNNGSAIFTAKYKVAGIDTVFNVPVWHNEINDLPTNALKIINEGKPCFKSLGLHLQEKIISYTDKKGNKTVVSL